MRVSTRPFALLAMLFALPTSSVAATDFSARLRYMSPRPNAEFVAKRTTIVLRLATGTAPRVPGITMEGSLSGSHAGRWTVADDSETFIFHPDAPFAPGEIVHVELAFDARGEDRYAYQFEISPNEVQAEAELDAILEEECGTAPWVGGRRSYRPQRGGVLPDGREQTLTLPTDFPALGVTICDNPDAGLMFLACSGYLMIVDDTGFPAFFRKVPSTLFDFKKQPTGVLSYFDQGSIGYRRHVALDSTYQEVDEWILGNGYTGLDFHEFRILPNGNALLIGYDFQTVDMSELVECGQPDAQVIGLVLQEQDTSKNVVFQWRSWDHFEILDGNVNFCSSQVDYVHCNAVEPDLDGNILISSRNMDEVTKIDRDTGDVIWRMGGSQNEFTLVGDTQWFSRQHCVRRTDAGTITVFDNGNDNTPAESRAVEYELDETNKIATKVWEVRHTPALLALFTGSVQRLPNGNTLISWGGLGCVSEVRNDGTTALEMDFEDSSDRTYRTCRFPWTGVAAAPTLWSAVAGTTATLYFTKFGDSGVAGHNVYADDHTAPTTWVGWTTGSSFPLEGFTGGSTMYCRVTSEDGGGSESLFSNEVQVTIPYPTSVGQVAASPVPWTLHQNRPNPFDPATVISFTLPDDARVHLAVYDAAGRLVRTLKNESMAKGMNRVPWDGTDVRGSRVAAGVYFYRLEAGGRSAAGTMTLLR